MNKFAVIDIGSNSVRLMLVADGKVLYKDLNTTRLGEGIAFSPLLKEEAIERSAVAVAEFYRRASAEGAEKIFVFATAAVRTAENGGEFVKKVKELCSLDVDVISGEEEAEIGIAGALGNRDGGIIDVGGASTEIIVREGGKILYEKSVNIGVVRLKDMCGREPAALKKTCEAAAKEYEKVPNGLPMYAIGGTATTLAAVKQGLAKYDRERVTGTEISALQMRETAEMLLGMSVEEISSLPCVPPKRADVLAGGAVLFSAIMERLGFDKIIVTDSDNLEGYAIKCGLLNV